MSASPNAKAAALLALLLAACSTSSAGSNDAGADAGSKDASSSDAEGGAANCSAARAQLIGAVSSVSTGMVAAATSGNVTTLTIDATAGGVASTTPSPWIFVDLGAGTKVQVTDVTSLTSTAWDLALKRPVLYTNDGDGGPGKGGAYFVQKDFDSVTSADATGATFSTESFFDSQCNPSTDPTGAVLTTFSTWYDYDDATHTLSPAPGTWLVRGGTGKLYKLAIVTYYGGVTGSAPNTNDAGDASTTDADASGADAGDASASDAGDASTTDGSIPNSAVPGPGGTYVIKVEAL